MVRDVCSLKRDVVQTKIIATNVQHTVVQLDKRVVNVRELNLPLSVPAAPGDISCSSVYLVPKCTSNNSKEEPSAPAQTCLNTPHTTLYQNPYTDKTRHGP